MAIHFPIRDAPDAKKRLVSLLPIRGAGRVSQAAMPGGKPSGFIKASI